MAGLVVALGCGGLPLGPSDDAVLEVAEVVEAPPAPTIPVGKVRNVLFVVADDLGTDKVAAYGEQSTTPATPNLDRLAAEGVLFENAYGYPTGAASRAAVLTGRYGRRTGLGGVPDDAFELALDEVSIPEMLTLAPEAWSSSALGKWGLAGPRAPTGVAHPTEQGFGHYAGALGNLASYDSFDKVVNGEISKVKAYATVDTTDDAIEQLHRLSSPWFLYVAYHAPHEPPPVPLKELGSTEVSASSPAADRVDAAVEALDHELGRLLEAMSPRQREETLVVFLGDNGTARTASRPPLAPTPGKGSLYEGGTNGPLIGRGPGVAAGARSQALVHLVDLFPTVAEVAEVDLSRLQRDGTELVLDGVSIWPALLDPSAPGNRRFLYTEMFRPNGPPPHDIDWRAVRDERFKVMDVGGARLQLFDLEGRVDDGLGLRPAQLTPTEQERYDVLVGELERVKVELP